MSSYAHSVKFTHTYIHPQLTHTCTLRIQSGWTALHFAVDSEHEDIVELLLKAEADPDLPKKVCYNNQDI